MPDYTTHETESTQPFLNEFDKGYIRIPIVVIDDLMPTLSANEFRVFLIILRKTWGWNKESDRISHTQMYKLTGIKDNKTIKKVTDSLVGRGLITRTRENAGATSIYTINRQAWVHSKKNDKEEGRIQVAGVG